MSKTASSASFYRVLAILPLLVVLALIRYFFPGASGWVWNLIVSLTLGLALAVFVLWLIQARRTRGE